MKIMIIDRRGDRGNGFLKELLNSGAIPGPIMPLIEQVMDSPSKEYSPSCRHMWPEKDLFPVEDFSDLMLNHLYATAQEGVPEDVIEKMKKELFNVMGDTGSEVIDAEVNQAVMQGSLKKFKRVLDDGTEVEVSVRSSDVNVDPIAKLKEMIEQERPVEKEAKIDLTKAVEVFSVLSETEPKMAKLAQAFAHAAAYEGAVVENKGVIKRLVDTALNYTEQNLNRKRASIMSKIAATDEEADNKVLMSAMAIDKRRLGAYPFNNKENAKKALSSRIADVLWDENTNSLSLDKLKAFEEACFGDPMMERVLKDVLMAIKWRD